MKDTKDAKRDMQEAPEKQMYINMIIELLGNADKKQLERLYYFIKQFLKK